MAGTKISALVYSANAVAIVVSNTTGGSKTIGDGDWIVQVFRNAVAFMC